MVKQISRIAKRTGWTLCRHISHGQFMPSSFEVKFVKAIGNGQSQKDTLKGKIDRVDILGEDDCTLVKVIDYKSSSREFDTALFREGISMQLIVYMDAAMAQNGGLVGRNSASASKNDESEVFNKSVVIPAGAFYYRYSDPIVEGKDKFMSFDDKGNILYNDEEIENEMSKSLKMTGIINDSEEVYGKLDDSISINDKGKFISDTIDIVTDKNQKASEKGLGMVSTEQFGKLMEYSSEMINKINENIKSGVVGRNPYQYGAKNACTYCDYASVCRYGDKDTPFRKIRSEKFEDFIKRIEAVDEDGMD